MSPADFAILFSWAIYLSGYEAPAVFPDISFVPHAYLEQRACGGRKCNVVGWYNDEGTIYLDASRPIDRGVVVHEAVHWLQHLSGLYDTKSCSDSVAREREAYSIQDEYETRTGGMPKPHAEMMCTALR